MNNQKIIDSASKASSEMESGDRNIINSTNEIDVLGCYKNISDHMDNPVESRMSKHLIKGLKTISKHKRLRNIKAFLLNKDLIRQSIIDAKEDKTITRELLYIMSHIDKTVDKIHLLLSTNTYKPKPYKFVTIYNKDNKPRHLSILGFYDRCVQQLLKNVILDKLRALEPRNVYSNLPGRGTLSNNPKYCLYGQLKHIFKTHKDYYGLKLDIHRCYESISTELIKRELFKYVTDSFARNLVNVLFSRIDYLPIGDPLSGLYVNLVLRKFHMHLLTKKHHLFKFAYFFCDDSLIIGKYKSDLHELCLYCRVWLPKHFNLYIKNNYKIYKLSEGITFCGARAFTNKLLVRNLVKKRMIKNKDNFNSISSYKGILDKTSSCHLARYLNILRNYE